MHANVWATRNTTPNNNNNHGNGIDNPKIYLKSLPVLRHNERNFEIVHTNTIHRFAYADVVSVIFFVWL